MKPEETPVEPGLYRLEDIQQATPMTRDELLKRDADIRREIEEQVRAEIRREMEEKMRAEIESEMKETAQLKELQRKFIRNIESFITHSIPSNKPLIKQFFEKLPQTGHVILYVHHITIPFDIGRIDFAIVTTNKAIYTYYPNAVSSATHDIISCIYVFTSPLNHKYTSHIANMFYVDCKRPEYQLNVCCPKNFELLIRLIPGSYSNGAWKQLDGFFGPYFNEETMEISAVPPPM